jgi:hypothetical protein
MVADHHCDNVQPLVHTKPVTLFNACAKEAGGRMLTFLRF